MAKRTTRSTRAAVLSHAQEEDVKPGVQELSARNFQPFSRTHRAELNELVGLTSLKPSVSFCSNWAMAHSVDPALVDDWAQRRTGGGKKESGAGGKGRATARAAVKTSGARRESAIDDIRVKRERAASPALGSPPKKRAKTARGTASTAAGMSSTAAHSSRAAASATAKSSTVIATHQPVRHTRAHDAHPHPGCAECAQQTSASSAVTTPAPGRSTIFARDALPGCLPPLKSALRDSALTAPVARRPRQVRFSNDLSDGFDGAYTHPQALTQPQDGAYTQSTRPSGAPHASPAIPPRFKRKLMMSGYTVVDALPALGDVASQAATLPTDPDSWPTILTSDIRSGASDDTRGQDASDHRTSMGPMLPPKRRRVSHPQLASPTLPLPLVPAPMSPPPRTPSPQVQVKIEGSFFSPSFFSSPTRSSSPPPHSDDERVLPSSSPPTSPFPVSSPKKVAPVPLRPLASRLSFSMQYLPAGYTPTQPPRKLVRPSRTHPCPDGPGLGPSSLEPRHLSADKSAVQDTNEFPPPADIPPRARTPPCPDGPRSGSRQGTPQPRPVRPDHGIGQVDEATSATEPGAQNCVEIKREQIALATAQLAGSTFVLNDEEDDEPLMIVVARRRKAQAEDATAQAEKPKTRAKRGAKAKDAKQAAAVTVKTESDEVTGQSVPPRQPKKRRCKKSTAKASAAAVKVEPAPEAVVAAAASAKENTSPGKAKKPQGRKAAAEDPTADDVLVPIIAWGAADPEVLDTPQQAQSTSKKTKKTSKKKTKENRQTAAPTRSESQDTKTWRPPHTLAHSMAHLELIGGAGGEGVKWDEKGFGCMELSALPWIAGVGYRAVEVRFGERDVLFEPAVPRVVEEREKDELSALLVPEVIGAADDTDEA
ncbi:hypothetical protein K466DRAFT_588655 [Polyporus arcularius HHB13444]|uniref:Uncharacterized protein n=1 Tax=Polyporus arcularius HHB13444 TaxID=1314778 RepID=A0A5C3P693_9APHY|nr:hypothetical protein K466DRAFT_588655 [Polyporus arcularius HHB13444]